MIHINRAFVHLGASGGRIRCYGEKGRRVTHEQLISICKLCAYHEIQSRHGWPKSNCYARLPVGVSTL